MPFPTPPHITMDRPYRTTATGDWLILTKAPIALSTAMATLAGYYLAGGLMDGRGLTTSLAVALMGAGACALNQWQEMDQDARMERTRRRPLPDGRIQPATALVMAMSLLAVGWGGLALGGGAGAAGLGALAAVGYNLIYTPLKRHSSNAVCWGAPIGALPPAIGWCAAGGSLLAPPLIALALFFLFWQIPHFRILQIAAQDDYRRAGFACLQASEANTRRSAQILRRTILLTLVTGAATPWAFDVIPAHHTIGHALLALLFGLYLFRQLREPAHAAHLRRAFHAINQYALYVVLLLCLLR